MYTILDLIEDHIALCKESQKLQESLYGEGMYEEELRKHILVADNLRLLHPRMLKDMDDIELFL